jgi:hypothetical protein
LLSDALAAALSPRSNWSRSFALAALAPFLPADLRGEALAAARTIEDDDGRSRALAALAPHLPEHSRAVVLGEALAAARAIGKERDRSKALAALAPHLPERERATVLGEALTAASSIGDEEDRSGALAALALRLADLPLRTLSTLWAQTLPVLAARKRLDLLADLRSLAPILAVLAQPDAASEHGEVARAILDVARWWP